MDLIRDLIAQRESALPRTALSQAVCAALDWRKPDGNLLVKPLCTDWQAILD